MDLLVGQKQDVKQGARVAKWTWRVSVTQRGQQGHDRTRRTSTREGAPRETETRVRKAGG